MNHNDDGGCNGGGDMDSTGERHKEYYRLRFSRWRSSINLKPLQKTQRQVRDLIKFFIFFFIS